MRSLGALWPAILVAAAVVVSQETVAGSIKDGFRPYVHMRVGATHFTDPESAQSVRMIERVFGWRRLWSWGASCRQF